MYHRYRYGSFAEYLEERIRGNCRGHLTNTCVGGISEATKNRIRLALVHREEIYIII